MTGHSESRRPIASRRPALGTVMVVPRLPLYGAFRALGRPRLLPLQMSFVVTDRCNSLCRTCNIGQRYLDDPSIAAGELTLAEYRAIFATIGRPLWITMSGGEPFMRKDFPDIVSALLRTAPPRVLNIPTNGTLVGATVRGVKAILAAAGSTRLIVNFSVDGVGAGHDEVRGFRNNHGLLVRAMGELRSLGDSRLTIGVNTVISRHNVAAMEAIVAHVLDDLKPDSYVVETAQIRPEYYNQGAELAADRALLAAAVTSFVERLRVQRRSGLARLVKAFRLRYYEDVERRIVADGGHRCYSGFSTCTLMPKGQVWSNTQRADDMGNIRDYGLDFTSLWRGPEAARARDAIRHDRCHCESSFVSYANTFLDPGQMSRVLWNFVRYP